ncbi:hypothetical protein MSAS_02940 [Mycobacterium saskatchewanense]|nr:hypothetical protein MSAS_02940 [Mycobacterium saskatchewanense]
MFDRLFQGKIAPLMAFSLKLDGADYRLVAANAAVPFLVNTPKSVNGTNLQIAARTIGIGRNPSWLGPGVSARLRFYTMAVRP